MRSSTKPKAHDVLHCHQRMIKQLPHVTCTENYVKFGQSFLRYTSEQTERHTNIERQRSQYSEHHLGVKYCSVMIWSCLFIQNWSYHWTHCQYLNTCFSN